MKRLDKGTRNRMTSVNEVQEGEMKDIQEKNVVVATQGWNE